MCLPTGVRENASADPHPRRSFWACRTPVPRLCARCAIPFFHDTANDTAYDTHYDTHYDTAKRTAHRHLTAINDTANDTEYDTEYGTNHDTFSNTINKE